ncbi:MAG: flagellar basal body P-ring formation protein FlgA [Alphaproteobacteria bacterium]|jgi:flagella basal body P-ring formation protein FlgA|nr:flagellar basal body P-ring formation protein FlgA [Alphaproteobacteria bacterium]
MNIRFALAIAFCVVAFSAFAQEPAGQTDVVVPTHDIARGAVLIEGDLTTKSIAVMRVSDGILRNASDVAGREAKRALRAGEFLRNSDLKRPTLVAKGANVTMIFESPGIHLTAVGRALAEGGDGDTIAVLNPTSYRQVGAVVTGPGTVRVGSATMAPATMSTKSPKTVAAARQ